ncbi:MAG: hypothetical protein ABJB40_12225 [Acidobacteriota bacterium]
MVFRPSFCANCGEKIERAEWGILTSRRFCQVCEAEFKGQDLIPRVIVGLGVFACVLGFGSYLRSGTAAETRGLAQPRKFAEQALSPQLSTANSGNRPPENVNAANLRQPEQINAASTTNALVSPPAAKPKVESAEPMYYCGAETKKGTPCSRRVKGYVRCYQHQGMRAMLPADKLRIN